MNIESIHFARKDHLSVGLLNRKKANTDMLVIEEIKKLYRFRRLVFYLTWGKIKQAERHKVLGRIWSLLNPLALLGIYYLIFNVFFESGIENFVIYLFSAIIAFWFLSSSIQQGSVSIISNRGLISEAYFPKSVLPLSIVLLRAHDFLYSLITLLAITIIMGIKIKPMILFFPIIFFIQFVFTLGLAIMCSVIGVFFRDIQNMLQIAFRIVFYASCTMYHITRIPEGFRPFFELNPIYIFYESYRNVLLYDMFPPAIRLGAVGVLSLFLLGASLTLIAKKEGQFIKYL